MEGFVFRGLINRQTLVVVIVQCVQRIGVVSHYLEEGIGLVG